MSAVPSATAADSYATLEARVARFRARQVELASQRVLSYREACEASDALPLVLLHGIGSGAASWVQQIEALSQRLARRSPDGTLERERLRLDSAAQRMRELLERRLQDERSRLTTVSREMVLLHPEQVMERGYAMVLDPLSGSRIPSVAALTDDQEVLLRFHDGAAGARRWRQVWSDHRLKHLPARAVAVQARAGVPATA